MIDYRALVEQVPAVAVVFALGRDLAPVYVSPQSEAILGVPVADWLEHPDGVFARIHPDDRVLLQMKLAEQARGLGGGPAEFRFTRPDGGQIRLRDVSGVVMEDGRHLHSLLVDITAEAEHRLAQRLEAVGRLAAGVAHEINTPVQFLGDTVEFLEESFAELLDVYDAVRSGTPVAQAEASTDIAYLRERVPAAFRRANEGLDRVAEIVRAMGEQAHPEAHVAADLVARARAAVALAGVQADTDLAPLPPVVCNAGEIEQVLVNLLVNAQHAGGQITVRTRDEGAHVRIDVADTGAGIAPAIAERVFDPFFTTKPVGAGTGQGLAIARALVVERHGGTLTFESEPGRGTTFHVRLPVSRRGSASSRPA